MSTSPFAANKVLGHLPVLNDYLAGRSFAPILVEIDLTNDCACECPWCFGYLDREWHKVTLFAEGEGAKERTAASVVGVMRLLDELRRMGVKAITWTGGGDPTQHKGVEKVVSYAAGLGFEQGFITHGAVDPSHLIQYLRWIRFSVDAANKDSYGRQHGKPQLWEHVLSNVKRTAERKVEESLDVTVGVGFLTHKEVWPEVVPFAHLWSDIPVDYIQYRPMQNAYGREWGDDSAEVLKLIAAAKMLEPRVTCSEAKYEAIGRGDSSQTKCCHGIFLETAISADGKVYTCCHHKGIDKYAIGDLNTGSFADVWNRHLENREFKVTSDCPAFCRHFGTNVLIEEELLGERAHPEFI